MQYVINLEVLMKRSISIAMGVLIVCAWNAGILVLTYILVLIVPFYYYGIQNYTYGDIMLGDAPAYPYLPNRLHLLVVIGTSLSRSVLLLYIVGLVLALTRNWSILSRVQRRIYSLVLLVTLFIAVVAWSPWGNLMEAWLAVDL